MMGKIDMDDGGGTSGLKALSAPPLLYKRVMSREMCGDHDVVAGWDRYGIRDYICGLVRHWNGRIVDAHITLCKCRAWKTDDLEYEFPAAFGWKPKEWPNPL